MIGKPEFPFDFGLRADPALDRPGDVAVTRVFQEPEFRFASSLSVAAPGRQMG